MGTTDRLVEALSSLLWQIPSLLAIVACLIAAFIRWKRHPRPSLMVVAGLFLLLAVTIIFAFIYAFVPNWLSGGEFKLQTIVMIISFIYNSLWAVALALLLAAIFTDRKPATS